MNIREIVGFAIENDKCEFKQRIGNENIIKWAKSLVAFANGNGGVIYIGVNNDGEVAGLTLLEIDSTKNLIATINDRNIFPHINYTISMLSVDNLAERFIISINVKKSDSIVRFREGDFNEKVFIKGDGNATLATPEEIIALAERKFGIDNSIVDLLYSKDKWSKYIILCKEFREDNSEPTIKELQNEEIISSDGLVSSGLIMFSDDYSGDESRIHCRLWKGKDKAGFVCDSKKIKGPIGECFKEAYNFIIRNTKVGWEKTLKGGRKELSSYPLKAVREGLINAIAHRDYSIKGTQIDIDIFDDRIDITSPGSWLLPKPYEEYPQGTIPSIRRNKTICACLEVANLMECGGTGFTTIVNSYKDCEINKQPVVLSYPGYFIIRLYDMQYEEVQYKEVQYKGIEETVNNNLLFGENDEKERVLSLLKNGPKKVRELQYNSIYSSRTYFNEKIIIPLINDKKIKRIGNEKSPNSYFIII